MKSTILTLTAAMLLLVSCGTKKAPAAPATPVVEATATEAGPPESTSELAEGKSLYENSCARCHKLYEPKKFTQEEWKPILVSMQKKAKLDDVKMASITNYIHSQL
ncbi:c-type cytochrome [Flavobacterium ajazii]|uniref:c-type cytochrome n=1 Tax=Flavobacterium ajazii TaxID=2692318 RepID=UPI0013D6970E|nr:cytochrome c [Flavobacterium ajazii]